MSFTVLENNFSPPQFCQEQNWSRFSAPTQGVRARDGAQQDAKNAKEIKIFIMECTKSISRIRGSIQSL
jgi:hypothetical protein